MTGSRGSHSSELEQTPLDSQQHGQAQNMLEEAAAASTYSSTTQADGGADADPAHGEALKDKIDGAVASGPKKADERSGGRVQVGETGDLHDLAAKRH
ncbi:hypothetical protein F4779DRAFT_202873 [Xylariaceae sp. FL0662B]|nr:hypothetical protein F4779DRAFT_202873 [Xylariaceae sp. FL0662B]